MCFVSKNWFTLSIKKCLRLNIILILITKWEINQVKSKCQIYFLDNTWKKYAITGVQHDKNYQKLIHDDNGLYTLIMDFGKSIRKFSVWKFMMELCDTYLILTHSKQFLHLFIYCSLSKTKVSVFFKYRFCSLSISNIIL